MVSGMRCFGLVLAAGSVLLETSAIGGDTNLAGEVAATTPPSISWIGPVGGPTTLTNMVKVDPAATAFRFSGARVGPWDSTYPHDLFFVASGITGTYAQLPYRAEFETDASQLAIFTLGTLGQYRLRINGEYVGLPASQGPPADGNFYWLQLSFPTSQRRAIRMESWGQAFGGVATQQGDNIYSPANALGPRCIVLGDSYTEGLLCYAQRLADLMGWEVWSSGVGGTGYLNPGPAGRVKFRDRVQADVLQNNPDMVIIAGGINDGSYPPRALQNEAQALYHIIITNLPSTKLVVVGPWWPRGNPPQSILDTRDAIKSAAIGLGVTFIDPIGSTNVQQVNAGWITGTGNVATPAGDGNADNYISSDGTHPTDLGHQYLATKLAAALRTLVIPDPSPKLDLQMLPGLQISGRIGRSYLVQWRTDLASNWVDATTVTLASSPQLWVDTSCTNASKRFYRALLLP